MVGGMCSIYILKTYRNPVHTPSWRQHDALLFVRERERGRDREATLISLWLLSSLPVEPWGPPPTSLPLLTWAIEVLFNIPRSLVNLCSARETGIVLAYLKAPPLAVHFTGTQLRVALWWTRPLFIRSAYPLWHVCNLFLRMFTKFDVKRTMSVIFR
jgi:hypothetical protein